MQGQGPGIHEGDIFDAEGSRRPIEGVAGLRLSAYKQEYCGDKARVAIVYYSGLLSSLSLSSQYVLNSAAYLFTQSKTAWLPKSFMAFSDSIHLCFKISLICI